MIEMLTIETHEREELLDITTKIQQVVKRSHVESGLLVCFVPHTTAAITINENADPDVKQDLLYKLRMEIPREDGYHHAEGNSDAHLKASLMGFSVQIIIENGVLLLGKWQGILFCEFDGPRRRELILKVVPGA